MVWIIAIIAILGNLYLFSGYDVKGDLAVFMVGVALIADVFVVYSIIKALVSKGKTTTNTTMPAKSTPTHVQPANQIKEAPKSSLQYPTEKTVPVTPVAQPIKGASVKCPVCKTELPSSVSKCSCCDFGELHREFINAEDAATWFENVVVPHRIKWEQTKNQPAFLTADELYAQMAAKQNKGISTHIDESASEFEYIAYKDGIELTRYNGNASSVHVPAKVDEKQVLKLGNSIFENCKWITAVSLPNGLTSIGSKAFRKTMLTHIVFPNSIEEIGTEAFAYSAVTEMVFPPNIKVIPKSICDNCKKLQTVIIMGAVEIEDYAFAFCDAMTKLALPETLIVVKNEAFCCCHALNDIVLPASLQKIYGGLRGAMKGAIVVLNDNLAWGPVPSHHSNEPWVTIYCNPGSTTQEYARKCGMKMKLLSEYSGRQ